jgi:hypothetical protein
MIEVALGRYKTVNGTLVIPLGAIHFGLARHRALLFKVREKYGNIRKLIEQLSIVFDSQQQKCNKVIYSSQPEFICFFQNSIDPQLVSSHKSIGLDL